MLRRIATAALLIVASSLAGAREARAEAANEASAPGWRWREHSDWYLGLSQGFGALVSGHQEVAPGSFTEVRVGAVLRPRLLVGVQFLGAFDIGRSSLQVLRGTTSGLLEVTLFPLPRGGLFVRGGAGTGAFWTQARRRPGELPTLVDPDVARTLAPGGSVAATVGQELRLRRSLQLALHARYDAMVIFDGPELVHGISLGFGLVWY